MQLLSVAVLLLALAQPSDAAGANQTEDLLVLGCDAAVTVENQALGFSAELDPTCEVDRTDCFQSVCRMCKTVDNKHTGPYRFCQSAQPLESALLFEAAVAAPTSAECAARVASGDKSVGISAIYDSSCANGGLGCFGQDWCRYCRVTTTKQSENFVPCSELSPTAASTASQDSCAAAASNSGLSDIAAVTDALCQTNARLAGCVTASSCRLCRNTKNERNQYLLSCKVLRERQQLAQTTTTVTAMTTTTAFVLASAATDASPEAPLLSTSSKEDSTDFAAVGAGALAGIVVALAAVAIRTSRARRVADAQDANALHRIDSILHEVGRDRIAQL